MLASEQPRAIRALPFAGRHYPPDVLLLNQLAVAVHVPTQRRLWREDGAVVADRNLDVALEHPALGHDGAKRKHAHHRLLRKPCPRL